MATKPEMMAKQLVDVCKKKNYTVATAESCTAGAVAARIASIPGASAVLLGGIVSYAESAKENLLGVPAEILASPGAVSAECAEAMARGARKALGCTFSVATTGFAGPGGGTDDNPVGTVYIAVSTPTGEKSRKLKFDGDRQTVTSLAVELAVVMLLAAVVHS